MYVALTEALLRAPLLPERALARARAALEAHPLGPLAVALASEGAATAKGPARARAWERYGRRAAFRATPQGLLAGVAMARLGPRTDVTTGAPRPHLAPTWARLAGLGRAILDDERARTGVRVRLAPSAARGATTIRWLAPGEPFAEERVLDVDDALAAILDATVEWTSWTDARRAVRASLDEGSEDGADDGDVDDLLLALVDDGLLATDATPPLVGLEPASWMRARLVDLGWRAEATTLGRAVAALARGELAAGVATLAQLPSPRELEGAGVHGVLVHETHRAPTLARAAVERAAALAPLLFRLQDALAPPASERLTQPALDDALAATTEIFGAGALDLEALAAGDYGVEAGEDDAPVAVPPDARVVSALVDAALAAARAGSAEAHLDAEALATLFADAGPAPPPTCELFLAPAREARGARPGAGWLLGLHAPAGSTWGRFEAALGTPLARASAALAVAERAARPGEETLDVSFAPSPALADLCAHGRARGRVLAISHWTGGDDLAPRDLELVADPGAASPLALRDGWSGAPVSPSPRARVRSSLAPAGTTRLLAGWSLHRQHAPWALPLGPLAALAHVPRLVLDGFVVAPASWRVPAAPTTRATLGRWRRALGVPRWVQVGEEDRLLPVDLDDARAGDDVAGHERVWEIWPPLGRGVDCGGRRVEAVVALVDRPDAENEDDAEALAASARATAAARRVPPPRAAGPLPGWRTFKLFGAREHQDAVLVDVVGPVVAEATSAREIRTWFFQRYVDGPGRRHHLRLRVQAEARAGRDAFEARLEAALAPARAAGAVVTLEEGDYHPERARFADALGAVHAIFRSDSELACAIAGADGDGGDDADRVASLVRALDALARGLGLDLDARRLLAQARRAAETRADDPEARAALDAEFRVRARALRAAVGGPAGRDAVSRALRAHVVSTKSATRALTRATRETLAPALLHLACVRIAGADRDVERRAYTFWERTLEGLARAPLPAMTRR